MFVLQDPHMSLQLFNVFFVFFESVVEKKGSHLGTLLERYNISRMCRLRNKGQT